MEAMDADTFSYQIQEYERAADEIQNPEAKIKDRQGKLDGMISKFAETIENNATLCKATDDKFTHLCVRMKHLSDSKASPETKTKMQRAFDQVLSTEMQDFTNEMQPLLRGLAEANQTKALAAFSSISPDDGIQEAIKQMTQVLENPESLLLFIEHGDDNLVSKVLFLCEIDLTSALPSGNTLLHQAVERSEVSSRTINRLIQHGCPINTLNEDGESPLMIAARNNNLAALKALVRGGAQIDVKDNILLIPDLAPETVKYLQKQMLKMVTTRLATLNDTILNPPNRPEKLDIVSRSLLPAAVFHGPGVAKRLATEALDQLEAVRTFTPAFDSTNLLASAGRAMSKNTALEHQIELMNMQISTLKDNLEDAKEPIKGKLNEELKHLQAQLKTLQNLAQHQQKHIELDVLKKALGMPGSFKTGFLAMGGEFSNQTALLLNGLTWAGNALTAGVTVYQNWNQIADIATKRGHLRDVGLALNASRAELSALYQQVPPDSMEGMLIRLRLGNIDAKLRYITSQSSQLAQKDLATKIGLAGTALACGLMAYGAAMYYNAYQEEQDVSTLHHPAMQAAGPLSGVSGFIPMIGPSILAGMNWLIYGKQDAERMAMAKLVKEENALKTELEEIQQELTIGEPIGFGLHQLHDPDSPSYHQLMGRISEIEQRQQEISRSLAQGRTIQEEREQEEEAEAVLQKEKKTLDSEEEQIQLDLEFGLDTGLGLSQIPQVGSAQHKQLVDRLSEIKQRQKELAKPLRDHAVAKQLGLTRAQVDKNLAMLEKEIEVTEKKDLLKNIIKAAGIDVSDFDSKPREIILEYLIR